LRYLLFALIGSVLYLLGTALLYGNYGTLDISLLAGRIRPGVALWLTMALMTAGLAAKTALFPLHIWLPPAHSGAPPAASALLSSLVVKASFFLTIRLWFDMAAGLRDGMAGQILGAMGACAILFGGAVALRQARLKLLIAYSTVAQLGYLFLIFPLASAAEPLRSGVSLALTGGMFQVMAHAFAKAAMFMAAGLIAEAPATTRLQDYAALAGLTGDHLRLWIAALSLIGVPPTGGFVTKWWLLTASASAGQWWWVVVILAGGLLAGGYMFRVLAIVLTDSRSPLVLDAPVSRFREIVVLAMAVCALFLGLFPQKPAELLQLGRTHSSAVIGP
jgi:formate hydrogenlyase subunit 3/multisubunit Na+/H+ antiporter MnhD subunit